MLLFTRQTTITRLLNYGSEASGNHLVPIFCYLDSHEELKENTGYAKRLNYLSNDKILKLHARLQADLFKYDKMLINGVDININFTRAPDTFYLLSPSDENKVRIKILDATLFIIRVTMKLTLLIAQLTFWEWNAKHIILLHTLGFKPLLRVLVNFKSLSIMHSSILVAFVKNSAFVGSASKNAHQFHQYDTTNFVLYVKGVHNPSEPLTMNCSSPVAATRVYEILFWSTGIRHDDRAHMITL